MSISSFDFGQSERLTTRLAGIIRNYPRGIGILKELIQNADDAGASQLQVVMDWRRHDGTRLPDPRMHCLMGPALLFVNDQRFSDPDLEGIRHLGEGSKLQSAKKTGRFGQGFNTVYNVTDYPSFLTNKAIYCFDPHQRAVANPPGYGKGWELADLWREAPDWPAVFEIGGLEPGATDFHGAIFRLPVREKGAKSEICPAAFDATDFEDLVSLAKEGGSELLLFTKNLFSLVIYEIDPTGKRRLRFRIHSVNAEQVRLSRAELLKAIGGNLDSLLKTWSASDVELPRAVYRHYFEIDGDEPRKEAWQVVSRLFRGKDNCILHAAKDMVAIGEKAVPWVGVAARIEEQPFAVRRCDGKLFCGLPLPVTVTLPIHVNGYFDLDSSRRQLTTQGQDSGPSIAARVKWNQTLLTQGIAVAWVHLLTQLAPERPANFYEIWPDKSASGPFWQSTFTATYQASATKDLINVRRGDQSETIDAKNLRLPPRSSRVELYEPLVADGIALPEPPLPIHVENGYAGIIQELTPQVVRDRLRSEADLGAAPAEAPRACLRKQTWVEALLRFCLSDGKTDDLKGLPLALLCDGKLHTFGYNSAGAIFIASEEQRALFDRFPHWFLDPEFQKTTGLQPIDAVKTAQMTTEDVIVKLSSVLGKSTPLVWSTDSLESPNAKWLAQLFDYLEKNKLTDSDVQTLKKLPVIPASDGRLHSPGSATAPLLSLEDGGQAELLQVLRSASIPLVERPPEVEASLDSLVRAHPSLFTKIHGPSVIMHLHARRDCLALSKSQAAVLLDFFSESRWDYDNATRQQLKELPVFPVASGLVRGVDSGLFRPAGFEPPSIGPRVHLLEHQERWTSLCERLGIQPLEQRRFLTEMVLPALADLSDLDRWQAWTWIRKCFGGTLQDDAEADLRKKLGGAQFRATDGNLHAVQDLHDPRSKVMQDVFGDKGRFPDLSTHKDEQAWLNFFSALGLMQSPSPEELLQHIDKLACEGLTAEARLRNVWTHVFEHWDELSKRQVKQERVTLTFAEALSQKAWFPALSASNKPGFRAPEMRLYRAKEMHESVELVGSQAPIFAWQMKPMIAVALGVQQAPTLAMLLAHFDHLLSLWEQKDSAQFDVDAFDDVLRKIYDNLGRLADGSSPRLSNPQRAALLAYRDRPCLWDRKAQRFMRPALVFGTPVPFFEPLRTHIEGYSARQLAAFVLLGSKEKPTIDDYIAFLRELDTTSECLSEPQHKQARTALKELANKTVPNDLPVLTSEGRLAAPSLLYWDDAPWLRDRLQGVHIADDAVPHELLERLKVRRLSAVAREELVDGESEPVEPAAVGVCRNLATKLRSPEFLRGLHRLLRHHNGGSCEPPPRSIARLTLKPMAKLVTEIWLDDGKSLGHTPVRFYFAAERNTLLVQGSSTMRVVSYLARTILRLLGEDKLKDLSSLEHILSCEPREISDVLNEDRIRDAQFNNEEISWASETPTLSDEAPSLSDTMTRVGDDSGRGIEYGDNATGNESWTGGAAGTFASSQEPPVFGADSVRSDAGLGRFKEIGAVASRPSAAFSTAPSTRSLRPSDALLNRLLGEGDRSDPNKLWGNVSEDNPPVEPGIGRSTVQRGGAGGQSIDIDCEDASDDLAGEIREKAIAFVLASEEKAGRTATMALDSTSREYDILSKDPKGEERHIKVKATSHDWLNRPVRVTQAQLDYAFKHREHAWLYVVERLKGTPRQHRIKDPAGLIRGFRIDSSWASLAEGMPTADTPAPGMMVYSRTTGALIGEILAVKGERFLRLIVRTPQGAELTIVYKPVEQRLEVPDGCDAT